MLSVRHRALLVQFCSWIVFLVLGWQAFLTDLRLLGLALGVALAAGLWLRTVKCPRCQKPLYQRTRRFAGVTWTYFSTTPPRRYCERCGLDLNERDRTERPLLRHGAREQEAAAKPDNLAESSDLSVRKLAVILTGAILASISGFPFGLRRWESHRIEWAMIMSALFILGCSAWLLSIRCPRCSLRLGMKVFSTNCSRCHWDLRKGFVSSA
jgi:hypothetical protein